MVTHNYRKMERDEEENRWRPGLSGESDDDWLMKTVDDDYCSAACMRSFYSPWPSHAVLMYSNATDDHRIHCSVRATPTATVRPVTVLEGGAFACGC